MKLHLSLLLLLFSVQVYAQQTVANARLNIGKEVTVSGIVTNGQELGNIRYFQDSTAGLAAYGDKTDGVKRGDSVTITGMVKDYNNLLELDPVSKVVLHSSNNTLPAPRIISINEIGEEYEGQLVKINKVSIEGAGNVFGGNENYRFSSNGQNSELRINRSSTLVGKVIPTEPVNLVGILSQYSFNDRNEGYQILPRDLNDLISTNTINFTSSVQISEISTTGFVLQWKTDVTSSSEVRYGTTSDKSQWKYIKSEISVTSGSEQLHKAYISGLSPSTIVFAEAFSVLGTDTAFSATGVYATQSNSSGKIKIYFNTPVDHSVSTGLLAQNIGDAIEDTLIQYINRATKTIDFCIYNINNSGLSNVSEALNAAYNRGVQVRFITDESTNHFGADDLDAEIPVLERPEREGGGIMHNKFAIFDANSENADNPWVWTGSTNITYGQVNTDANNSVFIQDQTLAKSYQIEFEEMWGASGDLPNPDNAKFGEEKSNNTPHHFIIGDIPLESYFSPSDNTNQKIIQSIETADNDLNVETMLITRTDLALAIAAAGQRGAEVHVITDNERDNSETANSILMDNLPENKFIFDSSTPGMLHHKVAIIDANYTASDPQVITGSHNWSNSANLRNDENTLIIHSPEIANIYFQQFVQRFKENGGGIHVVVNENEISGLNVFPNPTQNRVNLSATRGISSVELFNLSGLRISKYYFQNQPQASIDLADLVRGTYFLRIRFANGITANHKIFKL